MTTDSNGDKDPLEPNHCLLDQNQRYKDDGLKIKGTVNGIKDVIDSAAQTQHVLQIRQQQQPQAIVRWERFLHVRSLRVLLVEYDDSTRHVVSALLRKCSYEVNEASNALQAWKVLEDLNNRVDLVLTEVVMPCLTGLGLLSKIMSHQTLKNVPIIMMSSHDSMGLVFKCLSKGAVDFLLKPIRKNELKNLWQHVWRRCHSSSGSGSESGTQTPKSIKSKNIERSSNNSGSNNEEDNSSSGLNIGDSSDSGSATQSSWTKQAAAIGSPQPLSLPDAIVECADSTCAQVIHSNAETSQKKPALAVGSLKCEELDNSAIGRDFEVSPRNLDLPLDQPTDVSKQNNLFEKALGKLHEKMENRDLDLNRGISIGTERCETTNMTGPGTSTTDHQKESREIEGPNTVSASNTKDVPNDDTFLELSLKRLRAVKDIGVTVMDDRNVLQRSDSSAFSRYNNKCSNTDMGSTTNRAVVMTVSAKNQSAVTSTIKYPDPSSSSSFCPMKAGVAFTAQQVISIKEKAEENAAKTQHLPLKTMATSAPHCGSSNVLGGGNAGNYSVNGSGSGSNHGSNGPNGSGADQSKLSRREAALKKFRQKRNERCFHKKVRYQSRKRLAEQHPRVRGQFVQKKTAAEEKITSDATNSDPRLT